MAQRTSDCNLLFGILALQMDFVRRDDLIAAMNAWVLAKDRALGSILREMGKLQEDEVALLDGLVSKHLAKHGDDPAQSLAALGPPDDVRRELAFLDDPGIQKSLAQVATVLGNATGPYPPPPSHAHGGRLRILRPHARGGLGEVLVARDEELGREVAVKEILPDHAGNPASRARFLLEAEVTGSLEHPGIVPVYGLGCHEDGRPFYVMRFIRGDNLQQAIERFHERGTGFTGLEFRQLLRRFIDVCNAIAYAHSRGVVHRDLKPGNVMLGKFGETLVVDWGLAKAGVGRVESNGAGAGLDEASLRPRYVSDVQATLAGAAVGTPSYMSPEQAAGLTGQVGPASDVYSLGATLYTLLTGQLPIPKSDVATTLERVRRGDFPPPRAVAPRIPAALDAICRKAMALAPGDRYESAMELGQEVERWLADEPVRAYREPLSVRLRRWGRRHRPLVAVMATASLLGAAGLGAWSLYHWHQRQLALQNVADRIAAARLELQGGNVDRAIRGLSEAAGLSLAGVRLGAMEAQVQEQLRELERYQRFQTRAKQILSTGGHGFGAREHPDPIERECWETLAIYDVLEDENWHAALRHGDLMPEEMSRLQEEAQRLAAGLITTLAMRLALFDTKDAASLEAARQALGLLERVEKLEGPSNALCLLRWRLHRRLGNKAEGDAAIQRASEIPPRTAQDHYLLGSITTQALKDPENGLLAYRRALSIDPAHYGAHLGSFFAHQMRGDRPGQIASLTTCIALRPDEDELYLFRGFAHFEQKEYELAHRDFDAKVRLAPGDKNGRYFRGRTFVILQKWREADEDFTLALRVEPGHVNALSWRGIARAKLGRHREAAADAEAALAADKPSDSTCYNAARTLALAAAAVQRDDAEAERDALSERYAARAVELLRRALASGFDGFDSIRRNPDLDPLRARPDFQALLKELEGR